MDALRLDVWLDVACLFKTRSEAQQACKGGKVDVNGQAAKPHREVRPGDALIITRPGGRRQRVIVRILQDTHIPKAEARALYEDVTPPPTPAELEMRELNRLMRPLLKAAQAGTPDRRQRQAIRKFKEGDR